MPLSGRDQGRESWLNTIRPRRIQLVINDGDEKETGHGGRRRGQRARRIRKKYNLRSLQRRLVLTDHREDVCLIWTQLVPRTPSIERLLPDELALRRRD